MTVYGFMFMEDVDNGTLDGLAVPQDQTVFRNGDDMRVPQDVNQLVMYHLIGSAVTRGQITSPELRKTAEIEVLPIDDAVEPTSNFPPQKQLDNPVELKSGEALNFNTTNSGAADTEQYGLVWLADSPVTPYTGGGIHHVLATGAITAVVDTWTAGVITLGTDLPEGRYAVVGWRCEGATLIAARLLFVGQSYRPMVIGYDDEADIEDAVFRNGGLGILGEFDHDTPPQIEVMCVAADTTQQLILDIVKIS